MSDKRTILTWIDLETTGLGSPHEHCILEFAAVFTDLELNELAVIEGIVPQRMSHIRALMNDVVSRMHTDSGLLAELEVADEDLNPYAYGISLQRAGNKILGVLESLKDGNTVFTIAGSNIGFDIEWIHQCIPALAVALNHRPVLAGPSSYYKLDVSSYMVGFPEIFKKTTSNAHRALPDVRASIEQHRKMRKIIIAATRGKPNWKVGPGSRGLQYNTLINEKNQQVDPFEIVQYLDQFNV